MAYENLVLGVQLGYPANWRLSPDQYLFQAYGFTLSDEEGGLILRVGWVYDASPERIEDLVAETIRGNPGIDIQRTEVQVNGREGVMLSPLPGINPVTCIYLIVDNRVYEIFYGSERIDAQGWTLLNGLKFKSPQQSLASLELPRAGGMTPTSFTPPTDFESRETVSPMAAPGCVDWPTSKSLTIPWDWLANGNGWTQAGPSYYGEGMHKNCDRTDRSNDYHALDFPLREWDRLRAPASGTVLYYGWASGGFSTLGRVVILDLGNGYQYLAAHLRGWGDIWLWYPDIVGGTVIGYAGGSGNGQDGYFGNHLHQAIYKDGILSSSGGVYGGRGVEPHHVRHYGNGGGYYEDIGRYQQMSW